MTNPIRVVLKHSLGRREFTLARLFRTRRYHLDTKPFQSPALSQRIEQAVQKGLYAAGYVAYEAAPAFDPSLR